MIQTNPDGSLALIKVKILYVQRRVCVGRLALLSFDPRPIVDFYPDAMQKQARLMLSETIKSIVSMRLLPMVGGGRVPALEIMKTTGRIREFIEDAEKTDMTKNAIEEGNAEGMITFDQYLLGMYRRGLITYDTAINAASSQHDFKLLEQKDTDFSERIMRRVEQYEAARARSGEMGDGI